VPAVAQLGHLIVAEPEMRSVWIALGLFFTPRWSGVGFAVLSNRLWLIAIGIESGTMLAEDGEAARRARRDHDFSALASSEDAAERLDPHHFGPHGYLWLLAGSVVACAFVNTRLGRATDAGLARMLTTRRADA
jgi:hypothetical protein